MNDTDEYAMSLADQMARKSPDPKTKVGCVIVKSHLGLAVVLASGYNHFPSGMAIVPDINSSFDKKRYIIHAEMDAISNLAGYTSGQNMVLYVTHAPCDNCCRMIAAVGIRTVVFRNIHKRSDVHLLEDLGITWRQV